MNVEKSWAGKGYAVKSHYRRLKADSEADIYPNVILVCPVGGIRVRIMTVTRTNFQI